MSPRLRLHGVRARQCATGFELWAAETANQLVAESCGTGIRVGGTAFDVLHATVVGCNVGIERALGGAHRVRQSIAWNNAVENYRGLTSADVFDSIGGFDGINGNLVVDPQLGADLAPRIGSPAVGSARLAVALRSGGTDAAGAARVVDGFADGRVLPDRGAFEATSFALRVDGRVAPGDALTFTVSGPAGAVGAVLLGFSAAEQFVPGVGSVLIGPRAVVVGTPLVGTPVPLGIPANPSLDGLVVRAQAFGAIATAPGLFPTGVWRSVVRLAP